MISANELQHDFTLPDLANKADVRSEPQLDEDVCLKRLCVVVRAWEPVPPSCSIKMVHTRRETAYKAISRHRDTVAQANH